MPVHAGRPLGDLLRCPGNAMLIEPRNDLRILRTVAEQFPHILSIHAFETEEHVIEWTVEVKIARRPVEFGPAFVEATGQNCITAQPNARTPRRFQIEVFSSAHGSKVEM